MEIAEIKTDAFVTSRITRYCIVGSWIVCVLVTGVSLVDFSLPPWLLYLPLLVSFVFLGLPHGAVDHSVVLKLFGTTNTSKRLLIILVLYVAVASLYLLFWWLAPTLAFCAFILLTWFHWGQGDLYSLFAFTGREHIQKNWHVWIAVFIRGGLPMLIPLIFFPDVYQSLAMDTINNISAGNGVYASVFSFEFRCSLAILFGTATLLYLFATYMKTRSWYRDLLELALLLAFFCLVNPIVAIGIYFCVWHSLRHILRVSILFKDGDETTRKGLEQFTIRSIPTTIAALLSLAGMYYFVPTPPQTTGQFVGLYLILIAALTLPHTLVVCLMDSKDHTWKPRMLQ